ncbi:NADPH-quinone reductase [Sporocytophaga myxococcoides]|uniref:NADPH-quinone reductase n=1 Tax=Sporocytophaga myxococcoides TaxID=153721 RepID=A0A098LA02_9BACT|nr:NAD(P)H-dependent oxidoreductase [Sporocytophaga myxococcoides]GAL83224.1 NADPH-quinone reductase [Sporocytophaga myxococcoides]
MKNVLIINGHPFRESFNASLAYAYKKGVQEVGGSVTEIFIGDLTFNPNLQYGYSKRMELEPDLLAAWKAIQQADHLVWVHPVWWGGLPSVMKGFIDRLFLPGMVFSYKENSVWWNKLLAGKTARIITTMDQPGWYYRLVYGRPSINQLKKCTLEFCGITPVAVTTIGIIKTSDKAKREKWIKKAYDLGLALS